MLPVVSGFVERERGRRCGVEVAYDPDLRAVLHRERAAEGDLVLVVQTGATDVGIRIVVVEGKSAKKLVAGAVVAAADDAGEVVRDLDISAVYEGEGMGFCLLVDDLKSVVARATDRLKEVTRTKESILAREGSSGCGCAAFDTRRTAAVEV